MEHNFLTEKTINYLQTSTKVKSLKDKFYTDKTFFQNTQKQKLKKARVIYFNAEQNLSGKKLAKQYARTYDFFNFVSEKTKDKSFYKEKGIDEKTQLNWVHLMYPEVVDIDYSEYSNEKFFKGDLFVKKYKDGLMLVSQEAKSIEQMSLTLGPDTTNVFSHAVFLIEDERLSNFGQIDWEDKIFDNLILYVVTPKINKNKAIKIILNNNENIKKMVEKNKKEKLNKISDSELIFLRKNNQVLNNLREIGSKNLFKILKKKYEGSSLKNFYLKASFQKALISNYYTLTKTKFNYLNKEIIENNYSFTDLKENYIKNILPHEQNLGSEYIPSGENLKMDKIFYNKKMIQSILLNKFCSFDTLPNGVKINIEHKTEEDCFLFWKNIDLFELFFNLFNEHNTKLYFSLQGIENDILMGSENYEASLTDIKSRFEYLNRNANANDDFKAVEKYKNIVSKKYEFKEKHILQEAIDSATGYLMPYDGTFELLDDPIYKFIRFREYEDLISMVISDKNERCLVEVFDKNKVDFKYMIWNNMKINFDYDINCVDDIYTKLATCIRDAKILIERDSTMQFRGRRTPNGCNTNSTYEIYFPRTRYRRNPNKEQLRKERDFFNESRKFSGTRRQHIRRLVAGHRADKKQLLLAKQMDFYVPEGHTYVKAATWGDNMTKREVRYRNTALNGIFYFDKREMSEAQKIDQMSSAGFEEYSEKYIQKLGYEVKNKTNYDGGIDIRAVKILDNMEAEDLLVQCKHWNSPIPPGEMRDFKTACDLEETRNNKKFMFITSSRFSPGAREIAEKFNIVLIDGDDLITNNKKG